MADVTGRVTEIVRGLLDYRKDVVAEIKTLEDRLQAIDQFAKSLGMTTDDPPVDAPKVLSSQDAGPQQVVEHFLRSAPGVFFRPREVGKAIMDRGYKPSTQKLEIWYAQVTNCLRRAARKGVAESQARDGKVWYGLKGGSLPDTGSDGQEGTVS